MNSVLNNSVYRIPGRLIAALLGTLILIIVAGISASSVYAETKAEQPAYILGVFPHLPPRELEKVFAPIAADLSSVIGRKIQLRSNTTYKKFSDNLDKQIFDIAFLQPFDYIKAADDHGYIPLATRTQKLSAILVVKEDSPLKNINGLKGGKISLPPAVAAVSYLTKANLRANGMEPDKDVALSFHRSHISCMQQVLIGNTQACGTAHPAMRFFQNKMKVKMKIISESTKIPHTLFVVHPRVPQATRDLIKQRILSWANSEKGKELLKRGRLKPFIPIDDTAYDVVRNFNKN